MAIRPTPLVLHHEEMYLEIAFSPGGTRLAATSRESSGSPAHGVVWDASTGEIVCRIKDRYFSSPVFSPSHELLATGGSGGVKLWDPQTGAVVRVLCEQRVRAHSSVAFSPDGSALAAVAGSELADADVVVVNPLTGQELSRFRAGDGDDRYVADLAFTSDGTRLVGTGHNYDVNDRLYAWSRADELPFATFAAHENAYRLAHTRSLRWIATSDPDEESPVWLWEARYLLGDGGGATDWECRRSVETPPHGIWWLLFSNDERVLAGLGGVAYSSDGEGDDVCCVRLWDPDAGTARAQVELPGHAYCMAFSPDSRFLVTMRGECKLFEDAVDNYLLEVWDAMTGRPVGRFPTASRRTNLLYHNPEYMLFSPDGRWLAVCHLHHVELWDTRQLYG